MDKLNQPGTVYTFYSYKGGVGRSMALVNVAALLAKWGKRVLIVDWDLEAPGIEKYLAAWIRRYPEPPRGIIDLMEGLPTRHDAQNAEQRESSNAVDWRSCLISVNAPKIEEIHLLPAGKNPNHRDAEDDYARRLRAIDWETLFEKRRLGNYLEQLRDEWKDAYDFVLIDSRTGITDIGGICTIHLPDTLVSLFTANEQSLDGVKDVMVRARRGHGRLPVDRRRLLVIPVSSRDESSSEYELAKQWRKKFAGALTDFFDDWIPQDQDPEIVLDYLKIPYFPYWSFGERVPVLEQPDPDNPKTLAFAYQSLARLILSGLDWSEARVGTQATEASKQLEAKAEQARLEARRLEEKATRERHAVEKAQAYLKDRVEDQLMFWNLTAASNSKWQQATFALAALGLFGLVFVSAAYFSSSEFAKVLWLKMSGVGFLTLFATAVLILYVRRYDLKQRIASGTYIKLIRARNRFEVSFPGDDPEADLKKMANHVESIIAEGSLDFGNPRAAGRDQGSSPDALGP